MSSVSVTFPDSTYTSSSKPSCDTLKVDLAAIETAYNAHDIATTAVHGITGTIVGTSETQTLLNKTLTSPVFNTGVSGTAVLDEDAMGSDSATKVATQQSIKAYADAGEYNIAKSYLVDSADGVAITDLAGNTINDSHHFFGLIILSNNGTDVANSHSVYLVGWRAGSIHSITAVHEGSANQAPRLSDVSDVLTLKLNSWSQTYTVKAKQLMTYIT